MFMTSGVAVTGRLDGHGHIHLFWLFSFVFPVSTFQFHTQDTLVFLLSENQETAYYL
jgi:hypothetical protein